ncbi:hypothetical protein PT015_19915 [Candidatus Mycobacterium wuenschmannii]|uniref:Transmembrane protein n=1 Tax=Candidatus Mycobacterium wuenschmannii TaxID=3027808 RepID=A0ABY8VU05_9MYCO|nr:hypothetical protein [Candidatus Mycobacterium wuenschmannii]WIM87110.1 hypothetical protein PT015_19915 [Candidatus Mycobacterium wuenschmannii]
MNDKGPFGFEPEDFEHVIRDATEGLRDAFEGVGRFFTFPGDRSGWSSVFEDLARRTRTRPETAGEAGDGVWAIYTVSADGGARVEEVYATELDALRANQSNTDVTRKVRFLPYGIAVSVLDGSDETA